MSKRWAHKKHLKVRLFLISYILHLSRDKISGCAGVWSLNIYKRFFRHFSTSYRADKSRHAARRAKTRRGVQNFWTSELIPASTDIIHPERDSSKLCRKFRYLSSFRTMFFRTIYYNRRWLGKSLVILSINTLSRVVSQNDNENERISRLCLYREKSFWRDYSFIFLRKLFTIRWKWKALSSVAWDSTNCLGLNI